MGNWSEWPTRLISLRAFCAKGLAALAALLLGLPQAAGAELPFNARFDWQSEGDIYQVWFHREFDGRLVQTAPIQISGDPVLVELLEGVSVDCTAKTQIGLPNWSVATGICALSRGGSQVIIEVIDCTGTQKLCEGYWRIIDATGEFVGLSGSGTMVGRLLEPNPLPWFYNGPTVGYNELWGTITIP